MMSGQAAYHTYTAEHLHQFVVDVLASFTVPDEDAALAADVLITSDLRGIDSHGVARLITYVEMLSHDRINPQPTLRIVRESSSTATVDGDNGLGLVVGPKANEIAMSKAVDAGSGWVSVCNTNHYGIAGYYVLEALKRDLIGWSMTNTTALVAPLWGAERMLGTNPIAIAFPGMLEPPIVIDLATCAAAYGKVEIQNRKGEPTPTGWIIGADGQGTTDPQAMMEGGAILPLGSDREHGGHKGYCLAMMVDVLCSVLSGANWGPWAPPFTLRQTIPSRSVGKGIGHFFGAMRIDAFIDPDEFKRQIDDLIATFRAARPAPGQEAVLIPGDPEREAEAIRRAQGIPVIQAVVDDLRKVSALTGVPFE